jgi:hypothetical protein
MTWNNWHKQEAEEAEEERAVEPLEASVLRDMQDPICSVILRSSRIIST